MAGIFLFDSDRYRVTGSPTVEFSENMTPILNEAAKRLENAYDNLEPCPCGVVEDSTITLTDRHGLAYPLFLCESCGLLRMNPQPSDDELTWYYSNLYRPLYNQRSNPKEIFENKLWKGEILDKILSMAGLDRDFSLILDIGCGGGWTLKEKHDSGQKCVGYDFSEDLIQFGRELGLDLRMGGPEEALKEGIRGDLLIYSHVLEHVRDPVEELRKLRQLLEEGGLLYIETPYIGRIGKRLHGDSLCYWQRAHLWEFQLEHVMYFANRAGLSVVWTHQDDDNCYVICEKGELDSEGVELPAIGPRVREQLLAFEKQRLSYISRLSKAARAGLSFIRRLPSRR